MASRSATVAITLLLGVVLLASPVLAFGAGNIPSLAAIEGKNFRHGDIEDILKKMVFIKGAKWSSKYVKRVYFGNWLRDYSQALDVGTVKSVNPGTIRVLIWVLSFMSFGFATGEFEVTDERLGVYRPEEHIDNPKDYADNLDARRYDARLRPPVHPTELAIDPATCMKNYIANENIGIATSAGYIKHSLNRSIHFGRLYTSGPAGDLNNEAHLNEALRCLGQALHTLEDFSAHSNYVELVLREMGMTSVFPHVGSMTEMVLHNGKRVFPLTTGTFGGVDFLHSVLGEAQDKFTQTELQEMDGVLESAHNNKGSTGLQSSILKEWLSKIPNCAALAAQADSLEVASNARELENMKLAQPHEYGSQAAKIKEGGFDAVKVSRDIMPILEFRDNAVKQISAALDSITERIPGLPEFSELMDQISDQLSIYVFSVLAPYIRPIIAQAHLELKVGSTEVLASAKNHQYEVWTNHYSSDPTHSMLSKDHFSNVLNTPAGMIAQRVVQYVVPRVVFAWENVGADLGLVLNDIVQVLHHPALRIPGNEIQTAMFDTVAKWVETYPGGGPALEAILNSEAVKHHKNHKGGFTGDCGHGKLKGGEWDRAEKTKSSKKSSSKKKDDTIKIGGVRVPTGGLAGLGAFGGIANAALAGYTGQGYPPVEEKKEKKKDKDGKEKDKYKEDKYKEDKYKDSSKDKDKKDKDKKSSKSDDKDKKDKSKDKKDKDSKDKKKDKYRSVDSGDEDGHGYSKYDHGGSVRSKSSSKDHHKDHDYKDYGKHHASGYEGHGGHHHTEEYEYEYRPAAYHAPPPEHHHYDQTSHHHPHAPSPHNLTPMYSVPGAYDSHHSHKKSHSRSRSRSHSRGGEYVEVEYVVPIPPAPIPPPPSQHVPGGYYYEDDEAGIVRGGLNRSDTTESHDSVYGHEAHRGYGDGWSGGYGKDYGY